MEHFSNLFGGLSGECRFATALAYLCWDMLNQYSPSVYNKHFANDVGSGNGSSTHVTMKHVHFLWFRTAVAAYSYCTLRPAKIPILSTQLSLSRESTHRNVSAGLRHLRTEFSRLEELVRPLELRSTRLTTSTNDWAKQEAQSGAVRFPALFIASSQSADRGRGANAWWSPLGNIAATFVLAQNAHLAFGLVPLLAGLGTIFRRRCTRQATHSPAKSRDCGWEQAERGGHAHRFPRSPPLTW